MATNKEPVTNDAGTHVWMAHPGVKEPWACPPDFVPFARENGWEYADSPDAGDVLAASTAEGEKQTGFDPAEHDVDTVNDHLAKNVDSPGEVARVLELERAGRNRKTVIDPTSNQGQHGGSGDGD